MTIDDAVELIIDHRGRTPKKLGGDFVSDGVQVISAKHVYGGRLHLDENRRFVEPEMSERWMPKKLAAGDVLLTSEASLGEVAYLVGSGELCLGQRLFALRARQGVTDGRFLYFLLCSPLAQRRLHARATGTTAQGIKQSELRQIELELPPLREQRRITSVLAALDDKIDSNCRLAGLIEQVVATLFQGRFIDPFPLDSKDEYQPEEWAEAAIGDLASASRDPITAVSGLPYLGLNEMPRDSTILGDWIVDEAPKGQANRFNRGDILFGKLRPYFRKVGVALIDGRCSTEILVLRPHDERYWGFVLGHVASQTFIDHCVAVSRGTRMPRAEWKDAGSFPVRVPPPEAAGEHTEIARDLYTTLRGLVMESRTLAATRDALLPKLISGVIRVPDTADPDEAIGAAIEEVAG